MEEQTFREWVLQEYNEYLRVWRKEDVEKLVQQLPTRKKEERKYMKYQDTITVIGKELRWALIKFVTPFTILSCQQKTGFMDGEPVQVWAVVIQLHVTREEADVLHTYAQSLTTQKNVITLPEDRIVILTMKKGNKDRDRILGNALVNRPRGTFYLYQEHGRAAIELRKVQNKAG